MRLIAGLLFLLATLSGCAASNRQPATRAGPADAPIETTIAAVNAEPAKFQDKFLRLRGLIYCWHVGCRLLAAAPGTIPPDDHPQSLLIEFPGGMDQEIFDTSSPASKAYAGQNDVGSAIRNAYVFSEATVEGRYHPRECGGVDHMRLPNGHEGFAIADCAFGATDFAVTKVVAVHKRWPSTVFPVGEHGEAGFVPMAPEAAKALARAYDKAVELADGNSDIAFRQYRAFGGRSDAAVLCVCRIDRCDSAWPRSYLQVIGSPNNPFECVEAKSVAGQWRFRPASFR